MKLIKISLPFILFFVLMGCSKDDENTGSNPTLTNWVNYQFDDENTGSNEATPSRTLPSEVWSFQTDVGDDILITPVLYDEKLYFGDSEGFFYCLNAVNGKLIWKVDANFSISSQPAVKDGRVYFGTTAEEFYCLDALTGDQKWGVTLNGDIDGSPLFYNNKVLITDGYGALYSLQMDGTLDWAVDECLSAAKPALKNGILYALSCEFGPVALDKDFSLKAIDANNGSVLWTEYYDGNSYESTISISESIAVFGSSGRIYGVDIHSRQTLWEYSVDNRITFNSSAVLKDNRVYFGGWSASSQVVPSYMECLDMKTGQSLWRNRMDDAKFQIRTAAVLGANDVLISVTDHFGLVAYGALSGDILWNFDEDQNTGGVQGSPIISGSSIFWASRFGKVYRLK